ncbi:hypothetical protein CERSUDRAFT_119740 [Gelatoporia subvermispora B]|uniref:Zn(2)-C6 fungal-type domain-containing protein n=1 Tax=Ceriporiopsis subvermispora (strain B) TaxID=914234 RepID=M2Q409_CERS8|nr:hypothetical protein CERSUDRAFT_119740 [Gelatoporia subvermispora B]
MSSQEEDYNDGEHGGSGSKKRRVQRACDICRRKKIRCDGGQMPTNKCSNCATYNYECTYVEAAKKRGPPKGYVENLETRLEKMEGLLKKLCPDADFSKELGGHFDKDAWLIGKSLDKSNSPNPGFSAPSPSTPSPSSTQPAVGTVNVTVPPPPDPDLDPSDDEVMVQHTLVQNLKQMRINPGNMRFFGKSSSVLFIQTAMDLKHEYAGLDAQRSTMVDKDGLPALLHRRPQYWSFQPWLRSIIEEDLPPHRDFPETDLLPGLIDLFFARVNDYMPLLHRPTFENGIKEGLHLRDEGFGSTVLLVCAIGARYSSDKRVFLEGYDNSHTSGWKWFKQVQMVRKSLLAPPRLYDLQIYVLMAIFLHGTSAPQACWTIIGVGIRLAQDVGAHRRKVYNPVPTAEEELWKRAFWVLVTMDRSISSALGRPCAIQDEDFDLDLPIECDDEHWFHTDPKQAFKQPPGKPSIITYFNCFLRLKQILAFALRTIYSINKSKALLGFVGQQWEQHIVAELDSALNKWIDSVPDHLRWDPNRENLTFMNQSAHLYATYYQLQISVHRPFIPSPRKPSPLSFPSLAICTNAARSCIHVLDVQHRRAGGIPMHQNQMALFTAGIVLLLNIWGGKRSGLATDPAREMADVHKCMKMLKAMEPRWYTAGRLWDILYELASVGDLPLPQPSPPNQNKRERDADSPISAGSPASPAASSTTASEAPRNIAGSRRVSKESPASNAHLGQTGTTSQTPTPVASQYGSTPSFASDMHSGNMQNVHTFSLPTHSDELGRMPLHPSMNNVPNPFDAGLNNLWFDTSQPTAPMGPPPDPPRIVGPSTAQPPPPMGTTDQGGSVFHDFTFRANEPFDPSFMFIPSLGTAPTPATNGFQPLEPQQQQQQQPQPQMQGAVPNAMQGGQAQFMDPTFSDNSTLAMWSNAPSGFEWEDWGTYVTNVSGMNMNMDMPNLNMNNPMGPPNGGGPG